MIAKNGYVITKRCETVVENRGSIAIPEKRKEETKSEIVVGFDFSGNMGGLKIGDIVLYQADQLYSVSVVIGGEYYYMRRIESIEALIGFDESVKAVDKDPMILELNSPVTMKAIRNMILIDRDVVKGYYNSNGIVVPFERRELGRAHYGTIVGISESASEATGFKVGMKVVYDYNSAFTHDFDYDMVKSENVFVALSNAEHKAAIQ